MENKEELWQCSVYSAEESHGCRSLDTDWRGRVHHTDAVKRVEGKYYFTSVKSFLEAIEQLHVDSWEQSPGPFIKRWMRTRSPSGFCMLTMKCEWALRQAETRMFDFIDEYKYWLNLTSGSPECLISKKIFTILCELSRFILAPLQICFLVLVSRVGVLPNILVSVTRPHGLINRW